MNDESVQPLRVLVLGTGAMGTAFAGLLADRTSAEVSIAGRWPEALTAFRQRGALVEIDGRTVSAAVAALGLDSVPENSFDAVVVLVKTTSTATVAAAAARARTTDGIVLTLQNGLGNLEILSATCGEDVFAGIAGFGSTSLGPGHVRFFSGHVAIGASSESATRLSPLATVLSRAGLTANISPDLERVLWTKLAINCALNPLAAIHRVPNGELLAMPEVRARMLEASAEVARVSAARGTPLGPRLSQLVLLAAERTAGNINSMLQDVTRGVPTEIESLGGALVREARRLGIPVPVNEKLVAAIRAIDAALPSSGEARPC